MENTVCVRLPDLLPIACLCPGFLDKHARSGMRPDAEVGSLSPGTGPAAAQQ